MLLQPKFVKTIHKWHASHINLTYHVKMQCYQCVMYIIFKVHIFSTISFTHLAIHIILLIPIVYWKGKNRPNTDTNYQSITTDYVERSQQSRLLRYIDMPIIIFFYKYRLLVIEILDIYRNIDIFGIFSPYRFSFVFSNTATPYSKAGKF
jgi:hypothetical protein